jgi:adenosine kinase
MSKILVTGSIAYDYIMRFRDSFAQHILPERLQILNVCFTAHSLSKNFGGTGGNIAYSLKLLQEDPLLFASAGKDFGDYRQWLDAHSIISSEVRVYEDEWTASAHIITDNHENQITAFHGGSMFRNDNTLPALLDRHPDVAYAIISADGKDRMLAHSRQLRERNIRYIYDPGHSIPSFSPEELRFLLQKSFMVILNEYETHLFLEKTQLSQAELLDQTEYLIVTKGAKGSTIHTRKGQIEVPAAKHRKVVDPTGAGDAYRGGILKAIRHGLPVEFGAQLGSVVASYTVEEYGTQSYSFTIPDFKNRFQEAYGYNSVLDKVFHE